MNIALRPSGGRDEYELAGTQGKLHISDLFGLPIFIEILPAVVVNAHSKCLFLDGKPRIRLKDPNVRNSHPASLIAGAMMLPKPRRKRQDTHGVNLLRWEQFVVQTVRIDVVRLADRVIVRPVTVRLENADDVRLDISFAERMARVVRVWTAAATSNAIRTIRVQRRRPRPPRHRQNNPGAQFHFTSRIRLSAAFLFEIGTANNVGTRKKTLSCRRLNRGFSCSHDKLR